jgi:hypothetical protein
MLTPMEPTLFNPPAKNANYACNTDLAQNHLIEQYKLYVEMADRISTRRNQVNAFFLTLHSSAISALCIALYTIGGIHPRLLLVFPFLMGALLCYVWYRLIRSYKGLNSAKFTVVGMMEAQLPASPWDAEWKALGEGKDKMKYWPVSHLEMWVPIVFAGIYLGLGGWFMFHC